jgi:threonine dehydratase
MWPRVEPLIDDALIATLEETAGAVALIAQRLRVIAEGAGALAVAAALAGRAGGGRIVAIVSGGNIDSAVFTRILAGEAA